MTQKTTLSDEETRQTVRDQFHSIILSDVRREGGHAMQHRISANQLSGLITRAQIAGYTAPAALETSDRILTDLAAFFNGHGTDRDLAQKILNDQQAFDRANNINRPAFRPARNGFGS